MTASVVPNTAQPTTPANTVPKLPKAWPRPASENQASVSMSFAGAIASDSPNDSSSATTSAPAATTRAPTSLPTISRSRCGSRSSRARNVPPENSVAMSAMNVTKTRKPTNEAPMANASVPPPAEASWAIVVPPRAAGGPLSLAAANTASVATTAKATLAAGGDDDGAPTQQALQLGVDDADHRVLRSVVVATVGALHEGEVAVFERGADRAQLDEHDPGVVGGAVDRRGEVAPGDVVVADDDAPVDDVDPVAGRGQHGDERVEVVGVLGHDAELVAARADEVGGRALVHGATGLDEHEPVADLLELAEVVRRHEHRATAAGQRSDQPAHLVDALRVEAVRRLVEDQQRRVAEQRGGDAEALLHAERVGAVAVVAAVAEPDGVEQGGDPLDRVTADRGEHAQVLAAAEGRVERRALDHRPDARQVGGGGGDVVAEHAAVAGAGPHEPEQHGHRRGLAGAVGTDEAGDDALRQLEVEAVDDRAVPVALGEAVHRHGRGVRCHASTIRPIAVGVVRRSTALGVRPVT